MIKFINGKYKYGNNDGISYSIYDEILLDGWTDDELTEDCWILEIPKDISKIHLFNAKLEGIDIIPRDYDEHDENRKIFWESFETYVFGSLKKALIFIEYYDGDFKTEIEEFYESIAESVLVDETIWKFSNLDELDKEFDVDFMNELEELVYSNDISMDSILNSMKLFMLDKYRLGIQEERLSRLN